MNTHANEKSYEIVNGPSRSDLFASCERSYDAGTRINLEFSVSVGRTMPKDHPGCADVLMDIADVKIAGIEHEDGSGNSFNLHGYCRANLDSYIGAVLKPYRFKAYFNTKTRKGYISFSD